MKRPALLFALLLVGATVPPSLLRSDAPALDIATSIRPVSQDEYRLLRRVPPGSYRCSARILDAPGSRRGWAAKDIVLGAGQSGDTSNELGQLTVKFHASIAKDLDRAETVVTVTRDAKVISRQSSTVWLQRQPNRAERLQ